jgi:aromatic ring-opening dioxygenase catalytic subunit (LigB family)
VKTEARNNSSMTKRKNPYMMKQKAYMDIYTKRTARKDICEEQKEKAYVKEKEDDAGHPLTLYYIIVLFQKLQSRIKIFVCFCFKCYSIEMLPSHSLFRCYPSQNIIRLSAKTTNTP